ncbi:hypothetical protein GH714_018934 [Hevea brasiliensis]|uniref:non-specific serine/threonine protein kinase n=1 Tax=Hevea brasiliensis TaxID=3981 RepID=A0A6A6MEW0_HEVBR|nr:hypothetical protein GH714_018934 [Hevea brasiliensis]
MSKSYAAIVGGTAGVVLVAVFILLWLCKSHFKNFSNKNSETGSSDPYPTALGEWNRRSRSSSALATLYLDHKELGNSQWMNWSKLPSNLMKVVSLDMEVLGRYTKQFILLTDKGLKSSTKLEFKQRLSIALGAAKGLCHLHGQNPPLVHNNFKTANVLVDENFIVKVAEAGISKLLEKIEEAGPSYTSGVNVFQDPEIGVYGNFTEMSDVYSFGVFLLELITGQEAMHLGFLGSDESLIQWVASRLNSNNFVDHRLVGSFTIDGIRDLIRLMLRCMSFPGIERPKMEMVVVELERIHEKEMQLTTVMGEGTATFIKGSELFTSK